MGVAAAGAGLVHISQVSLEQEVCKPRARKNFNAP
jgi:hypothetical protein